ncbi:MAG: hypothetical protein IJG23_06640 [Clostridia bacterium]|nr:hypothetical protein [Clostridia bacterium]
MIFKTFDVANTVIEEASTRFKPLFGLNRQKLKTFEKHCSVVDSFIQATDAKTLTVDIDEIKMTVALILELDAISMEAGDILLQLTEKAEHICVKSKNNELELTLFFQSLWNKERIMPEVK